MHAEHETPPDALFDAWTDFGGLFVRAGATPLLLEMIRNAFYAGAATTLALVYENAQRPDGDVRMDALMQEVHAFKHDLRAVPRRPRES